MNIRNIFRSQRLLGNKATPEPVKPAPDPQAAAEPRPPATVTARIERQVTADLCVYGASPAGIMAAIAAARSDLSVVLVEPTRHVGGLLASGLNATDAPVPSLIKGLVREFFSRCSTRYGQRIMTIRHEPKVCGEVFHEMLRKAGVRVILDCRLERVRKIGGRVVEAETSTGQRISAKWWVDGTYEGDLMPLAQISHVIGRESRDCYGEAHGGVGKPGLMYSGVTAPIDPFRDGKPLPYLEPYEPLREGAGDWRVQAYCFRVTLTSDPENMRELAPPENYNPENYELFRRLIRADGKLAGLMNTARNDSIRNGYLHIAHLPNKKVDLNSGNLIPTNNPLLSQGWIAASRSGRDRILEEFRDYTQGVIWFLRTDPAVPQAIQGIMRKYWYPQDEYRDGFPPALYVREGRRLSGEKVVTVNDLMNDTASEEGSLGQGAYHLDCKPARWYINAQGTRPVREGQFFSKKILKFQLPMELILPRREEARNLLVVNAISSSHVAFGSIRMEPIWMTLGASAGVAVALAQRTQGALHALSRPKIRNDVLEVAEKQYLLPGK